VKAHHVPSDEPRERSVLIAEDHEDSRDALRALLEAVGYRVHVATNGREAIEQAIATRPDLILMDIMMPELDGLEATRALRGQQQFSGVPILVLTAMEGARERALEAGCDDYITKPIDVQALFRKIREWIASGRS
jgi:two-component system cell cycle response regulator DivK